MEKLQRFRFEQAVQDVTINSKSWLKEEFKAILESNKPYQSKCDYIGYSIASIDDKIKLIEDEIKQLQEYKKHLKDAKELTLITGAEIFNEYGISKIEGAGISSITTTKETSSSKTTFTIIDEQALIDGGFYKKVVDTDKIKEYYFKDEYKEFIEAYTDIDTITTLKPSKLRINKRKSRSTTTDILKVGIAPINEFELSVKGVA